MKTYAQKLTICLFLITLSSLTLNAQKIKPSRGYDTQIGNVVSMLQDLKYRVTQSVSGLSQEETDFLLDEDANRIGAMIYHLAATEKYYQLFTFENRGFNQDEQEWAAALSLGENGRKIFKNKPIKYYLDIWKKVRKETLRLLKKKDDEWFNSNVGSTNMNNHWAWYHVMEHQANHMGQIRLIIKRIGK